MHSSATVRAWPVRPCAGIFSAALLADRFTKTGSSSSWIMMRSACRAVERPPSAWPPRPRDRRPFQVPDADRDTTLSGPCTTTDRTACFPGNIIPQNRIVNPAALALFANPALYPLPNTTGTGALGLTNNYITSTKSFASRDQADIKIDARLTAKDNISARYTIVNNRSGASKVALRRVTVVSALYTESAVLNWVRLLSPSMVNEFRAGWTCPNSGGTTTDVAGILGNNGNAKFGG